jgi:hypothetical protein
VVEVTAPDGYEPDSIKSYESLKKGLDSGEFTERGTGKVINCPVLDERMYIEPTAMAYNIPRPRIEVWYRTKQGSCFLADGRRKHIDTVILVSKVERRSSCSKHFHEGTNNLGGERLQFQNCNQRLCKRHQSLRYIVVLWKQCLLYLSFDAALKIDKATSKGRKGRDQQCRQ